MKASYQPIDTYDPVNILQDLVRFDTTNPPGNEGPCIAYIQRILENVGIKTSLVFSDPNRPNLIARLKGQGSAPPLLLYGHIDVVTAKGQQWTYPPFEGQIQDGYLWGRGALDMKGGIAMMLSALLRAHTGKMPLPGDVIFAVLSDEESMGVCGAACLVEEHAELFDGVKYAISEFGGFTLYVGGKKLYPIMVSEKQACWITASIKGEGGHGSMPVRGGAVAKAAKFISLLDRSQLPVHLTTPTRLMFKSMATALGGIKGFIIRQLANPFLANLVLNLMGKQKRQFSPLLHNTVSVTGLKGSEEINVIPNEVMLEIDGRLLPGYSPEDLIAEMRALDPELGDEITFTVKKHQPGPAFPDLGLFSVLKSILEDFDPDALPVPMVLPAVTDARLMSKLGIQTYGFLPMQLPEDFHFYATAHGADERIPLEAMTFGIDAIHALLQRFGEAP